MPQSYLATLQLKLDDWRVRQHFKRVERILRSRDVSHLSPELQQARHQHLNRLHAYAERGIFPRNHERPIYAPCFIDRDQRECAVAHLMITSGHADAAHKIATTANYAFVPQMSFPELDDWASETGFSRNELALIQPGYYAAFTTFLMPTILIWALGGVALLFNIIQMGRRQIEMITPVIGFIACGPLLLLTLFCFYCSMEAKAVATGIDYAPVAAWVEVNNFGLATVISLIFLCLTFALSVRRTEAFLEVHHTAKEVTYHNS